MEGDIEKIRNINKHGVIVWLDYLTLEKKEAQRKQELLEAIENSSRSYDEIMAFLKAED